MKVKAPSGKEYTLNKYSTVVAIALERTGKSEGLEEQFKNAYQAACLAVGKENVKEELGEFQAADALLLDDFFHAIDAAYAEMIAAHHAIK
jgi:hypothetical protein